MRQQSDASGHQVIDLRRAVDLLSLRADVDRKRIGYVGHGFNAHTGAILAGVEIRIDSYVLWSAAILTKNPFLPAKTRRYWLTASRSATTPCMASLGLRLGRSGYFLGHRTMKASSCSLAPRTHLKDSAEIRTMLTARKKNGVL